MWDPQTIAAHSWRPPPFSHAAQLEPSAPRLYPLSGPMAAGALALKVHLDQEWHRVVMAVQRSRGEGSLSGHEHSVAKGACSLWSWEMVSFYTWVIICFTLLLSKAQEWSHNSRSCSSQASPPGDRWLSFSKLYRPQPASTNSSFSQAQPPLQDPSLWIHQPLRCTQLTQESPPFH